ncbi:hypothetical protein GCM10023336_23520 [Streptomyces similanensis]|uniref:Uncharacterized protein n=1 Tax=Streptomyces similanensis TaxID=1274988 RepID=A0ABP9KCG3_9ACTN
MGERVAALPGLAGDEGQCRRPGPVAGTSTEEMTAVLGFDEQDTAVGGAQRGGGAAHLGQCSQGVGERGQGDG